jgi:1-aminocyclopropane-1-carboxylate deaminase
MQTRFQLLKDYLATTPQMNYPIHSRVHALHSFSFPKTKCYVKRDDELGFGISGSKARKYRSLLPFLLAHNFQEVIVIGSAYSNHVLSLVQLLIENGLQATLFLLGDPQRSLQGNALLTSLFTSSIRWFSKAEWKNVESEAHSYAKQQKHPTYVLPEGGFCQEAFPGALTLALDVILNEEETQMTFDHIFIEAGTGFTACALILGLSWLEHPACVHVLLLAEDEEAFLLRLKLCHEMFMQLMSVTISFPQHFAIHSPQLIKGFGKVSSLVFDTIADIARTEGFLTDPIYSAKLFLECKNILKDGRIQGNLLIHHSGGSLTLMGFQNQLQKLLEAPPNVNP